MPKNNSIPKNYDVSDMHDLAFMAECDMQWMNTAITDVKKRIKEIKNGLGNKNIIGFYALEQVLEMYEYLAGERLSYHAEEAERYSKEWEQLKGGRNA